MGQNRRVVNRGIAEIVDEGQFVGGLHVMGPSDVEGTAAIVGGILLPVEIVLCGLSVERRPVVKFDAGAQLVG